MNEIAVPHARSAPSIWLEASRPKTLVAGAAPVVLAAIESAGKPTFSMFPVLAALAFAVSIQVTTNIANDLFDFINGADNENRVGPQRVTQAGLVSERQMRVALRVLLMIDAAIGVLLIRIGGPAFAIIAPLSILFSLAYTAGPFPLGYLGLGEIFVFLFFGPVAACGTELLASGGITLECLAGGISLGLLSSAILVVNNLRDEEGDRLASKRTLVVRFGSLFGRCEYILFLFLAGIVPVALLFKNHPWIVLCLLYFVPAKTWGEVVWGAAGAAELSRALAGTAKLLVIFTVLYVLGTLVH